MLTVVDAMKRDPDFWRSYPINLRQSQMQDEIERCQTLQRMKVGQRDDR